MDETKIVLSETTYFDYLCDHMKLEILRDLLSRSATYTWENIIRGVLDIPEKEEKE